MGKNCHCSKKLLLIRPFGSTKVWVINAGYGKSTAQVALRFLIQSGVVVIPKSTHVERMEKNFNVFDFELTAEEMAKVEALDGRESLFFSHYDYSIIALKMPMAVL